MWVLINGSVGSLGIAVRFAFGDSYGLGRSSSEFHTDLLITNPSIFFEGECVMEKGKFVLDV